MTNIDEKQFEGLSEKEKEIALRILQEYSNTGKSETYNNLLYEDYNEIPVDIITFISDDRYLGNAWKDADGKLKLYPFWQDRLKELFPDNLTTSVNNLIESGARGLGKSEVAVTVMLYLMYRLMCLKNPHQFLHLKPTEKVCFAFMNITIKAVESIANDKFQNTVKLSPWFLEHGTITGITNKIWNPPDWIQIILGSQSSHVIGLPIYCAFFDEINFVKNQDIDKQKKIAIDMIDTALGGMQTRFIYRGKNPTLMILASSKRSEKSFLEEHMKKKLSDEDASVMIVDKAVWDVKPPETYSGKRFNVAVGNKFLVSEIMPEEASIDDYIMRGYNVISVPEEFKSNFRDDIDRALQDYAGISSSDLSKYISGVRVQAAISHEFANPFVKDVIEVGNAPDDTAQYKDFFDLTKIPENLKSKPLYIHLDMSVSGDKTGLGGVWISGKKNSLENSAKELTYQMAFGVSIKAPKGYQVSFAKNREFIYWLKEQGFNVKGISCFKGDAEVSTKNGPKKIKDIEIGDEVYCFDEEAQKITTSRVYNKVNNGPRDEFIKLWVTNDDFIECTPEHLIKTSDGYKMAKDITEEDSICIDDKLFYKNRILKTGLFVDNEYLDNYIDIITGNCYEDYSYFENHHIIPRYVFKFLNKQVDNSDLNIVKLSYKNHLLCHYYLSKCSVEKIQHSMLCAVMKMLGNKSRLNDNEFFDLINDVDVISKISTAREEYSKSLSKKMIGNSNVKGRKHTQEEINKIKQSNKKPHNIHPKTEFKEGEPSWNKGKHWNEIYSDEQIKKMFAHNQNYIWVTDGKIESLINDKEEIPSGFIRGRLNFSEETKRKISETNKRLGIKPNVKKGFKFYTNGDSTIKIFPGDIIPEGFHPGRKMNCDKRIQSGFLYSDDFKKINKDKYIEYYKHHSTKETISFFNISIANHKKLCNYYGIRKRG